MPLPDVLNKPTVNTQQNHQGCFPCFSMDLMSPNCSLGFHIGISSGRFPQPHSPHGHLTLPYLLCLHTLSSLHILLHPFQSAIFFSSMSSWCLRRPAVSLPFLSLLPECALICDDAFSILPSATPGSSFLSGLCFCWQNLESKCALVAISQTHTIL